MSKIKTPTYVLTLPLNLEKYQVDVIKKRLEISRNIYNALLGKVLKRYNLMIETREYRNLQNELKEINEKYHDKKPPRKIDKETGRLKVSLARGDIGIDIGTQTIAVSSGNQVKLLELCPEIENIEKQKRILLRKLDR